ncbi:glycosyltransferase [Escherichia coli]|uniref:Glycosyltransferase family 4 protein n=1 Tax=Escherichia coli TaxID=562 RepID=A0A8S7CU30_ECOLX|nr:glycosyltransferase [Escherichia coli]EFA4033147.1 glycosyltransferase family 4 protein [Escherichia coli O108:H9]EFB2194527.1 glycosyltransferase family 4 protein [Escherichia coli]EFB6062433.1 glycosyltransferase family 4 protein [Escherichia coli]EFG8125176.1 glycosyltransferase family 4 protein [Escherichia coli]EFJ1801910.1 glycosyltransferase family 4 protein [Escherichia coli]
MSLLINASNLYVGGGVQVAVSVLEELTKGGQHFIAAVSPVVAKQLSGETLSRCKIIRKTPSNVFNVESRRDLDQLVAENKITKVFTIFGPSYWSPKNVKHAVGFALPWLIYDVSQVFPKLSFREKVKKILLLRLQPYFYKKNADLIFVETDDAKNKLVEQYHFKDSHVVTVPNTINAILQNEDLYDNSILDDLPERNVGDIYLLTISHDYPHKNLTVIPKLIELLPDNYKFIVTLSSSMADIPERYSHRVINVGPVSINQCPALYHYCDALFLPTLLECFSASYVEAMYFKKMIFTSDLPFAHTVCDDSAIYFDPYDANDICDKIISGVEGVHDKVIKQEKADLIFSKLPTAKERALMYMRSIDKL